MSSRLTPISLRQSLNMPIQSLNVPIFATFPGIGWATAIFESSPRRKHGASNVFRRSLYNFCQLPPCR
jgi:hypothetical protein